MSPHLVSTAAAVNWEAIFVLAAGNFAAGILVLAFLCWVSRREG